MSSAESNAARRQKIAVARAKAQARVNKRTLSIKRHNIVSKKKRALDAKRKNKQKQIASLQKQGRHVDVAEAKERYQQLSDDYAKAHRAAKAHARKAYGAGAGRGNFKGTLRQTSTPAVKAAVVAKAKEKGHVPYSAPGRKSRPSAPSVSSGSSKKPKSTTPKVNKLTKEQYKNLVKQRQSQADKNYGKYGTDDAKRKGSAGQKIYNSYDKKLKNSQYSYKSHVAAMKRRGKKATAATYAKFKRYNGI